MGPTAAIPGNPAASCASSAMGAVNNCIPDQVKTIHLIAACGTGMGALACMLQDLGYTVTGSDHQVYPPMSEFLARKGVRLFKGFSPDHLVPAPDLVIMGNAVTRNNVEAVQVMARQIPCCSMPQALNHFVARGKRIVLVTGTHGKTTTSAIIAHLLHAAGLDPTFMIGGILSNFNSNYRLGRGKHMVIEGDEYDTAFFDKGPKFLHYPACITVMNGIEFDHADIFRDLDHIKQAFTWLVSHLPSDGVILANGEDAHLADVLENTEVPVEKFGRDDYHWTFSGQTVMDGRTLFQVTCRTGGSVEMVSPLMGRHNAMNSLAAVAVLRHLGVSFDVIRRGLSTFKGIRRRQEIRGRAGGITVMDDFAHHPTAVKETLAAVRPFFESGRIFAVFEPRTNSSMRDVFQKAYAAAFDGADITCIRKPSRLDKVSLHQRLSTEKLVADIAARGNQAHYFTDTDTILPFLKQHARKGDLILIMSNGGFDNIHQRLLEILN